MGRAKHLVYFEHEKHRHADLIVLICSLVSVSLIQWLLRPTDFIGMLGLPEPNQVVRRRMDSVDGLRYRICKIVQSRDKEIKL